MGGSAFSAILPASALPRIPPAVYHAVKTRLTTRLQTLYAIVSTPVEAPEKKDHGDLDFLVCEPLDGAEVAHEKVQALLNAKYVVPMPGNRTSSYAVPVDRDDSWSETENQEIYYQVILLPATACFQHTVLMLRKGRRTCLLRPSRVETDSLLP
jgi:hypothetical protein